MSEDLDLTEVSLCSLAEAFFILMKKKEREIIQIIRGKEYSMEEKMNEIIEFLKEKTLGQKVFLKLDNTKHDDEKNLLCYLYLRNKTFVNAHLIKNGLADVDAAKDYNGIFSFFCYLSYTQQTNS